MSDQPETKQSTALVAMRLTELYNPEEMNHLKWTLKALYEGTKESALTPEEQLGLKTVRNVLSYEDPPIAPELVEAYFKEEGQRMSKLYPRPQVAETSPTSTTTEQKPKKSAYHRDHFMMDLTGVNEAKPIDPLFIFDEGMRQTTFMPRGKVCILVSEGGIGKSLLCLHLASSLALPNAEKTHLRRPPRGVFEESQSGLGFFLKPVPRSGKVVLLFAEEDENTCLYRLQRLLPKGQDGRVDPQLLKALSGRLIPMPLSGLTGEIESDLSLSGAAQMWSSENNTHRSPEDREEELRNALDEIAGDDGIDLIIFDPLAQFGGADFEKDNAEATRLMHVFDRLTAVKGNPAVLLIHHSSKSGSSNKDRLANALRGSSALHSSARWVAILKRVAENQRGDEYLKDDQGRTVLELIVAKFNNGVDHQRVRYLSHRAEISPIDKPELLTAEERQEDDTSKGNSKKQSSSANDRFRRT